MESKVYAFAGEWKDYIDRTEYLKDCEVLHLKVARAGQALPSRKEGKHRLTPCLFRDLIYIVDKAQSYWKPLPRL